MKNTVTVNWDKQVSLEKSHEQVMTTVDKEQWHAPAFQLVSRYCCMQEM